jgi:hypothetical protein
LEVFHVAVFLEAMSTHAIAVAIGGLDVLAKAPNKKLGPT